MGSSLSSPLLRQVHTCPREFLFLSQVGPRCHFTHLGQQPGTHSINSDPIARGRTAHPHQLILPWGLSNEGSQQDRPWGTLTSSKGQGVQPPLHCSMPIYPWGYRNCPHHIFGEVPAALLLHSPASCTGGLGHCSLLRSCAGC